jgi:hypothetical protein
VGIDTVVVVHCGTVAVGLVLVADTLAVDAGLEPEGWPRFE